MYFHLPAYSLVHIHPQPTQPTPPSPPSPATRWKPPRRTTTAPASAAHRCRSGVRWGSQGGSSIWRNWPPWLGGKWWMIFTEHDSMYYVIHIYIYIFFISEGKQMYLIIPHHIGAFYLWKWLRWLAMIETWSWWCLRDFMSGKAGLGGLVWCMKNGYSEFKMKDFIKKNRQYWWFPLFTLARIEANPNRSSKLSALNHWRPVGTLVRSAIQP